jgi:hypothetical protein
MKKVMLGPSRSTAYLETVVGSVNTNHIEVFFIDPATGLVLDGSSGQPHISIPLPQTMAVHSPKIGDFNGDGAPDILIGNTQAGVAYAILGSIDVNGVLSYPGPWFPLTPNAGQYIPATYGGGLATGRLPNATADLAAVGAAGAASGSQAGYGGVFLFSWNGSGFAEYGAPFYDPYQNSSNFFGTSVAFGSVTGSGSEDLAIGATATASGASNKGAGAIWVYPSGSDAARFALSTNVSGQNLGAKVGVAGNTNTLVNDLIGLNPYYSSNRYGWAWGGTQFVTSTSTPWLTFAPSPALQAGWSTGFDLGDLNGDGMDDILVGAPNASPSGCPSNEGVAYVYFSNAGVLQATPKVLPPPAPTSNGTTFGWSMATLAGDANNRIFGVGAKTQDVNGASAAGQVYIYKVLLP